MLAKSESKKIPFAMDLTFYFVIYNGQLVKGTIEECCQLDGDECRNTPHRIVLPDTIEKLERKIIRYYDVSNKLLTVIDNRGRHK